MSDTPKKPIPVAIQRIMDEVREEKEGRASGVYNRCVNKHSRSMGYNRAIVRHSRS